VALEGQQYSHDKKATHATHYAALKQAKEAFRRVDNSENHLDRSPAANQQIAQSPNQPILSGRLAKRRQTSGFTGWS